MVEIVLADLLPPKLREQERIEQQRVLALELRRNLHAPHGIGDAMLLEQRAVDGRRIDRDVVPTLPMSHALDQYRSAPPYFARSGMTICQIQAPGAQLRRCGRVALSSLRRRRTIPLHRALRRSFESHPPRSVAPPVIAKTAGDPEQTGRRGREPNAFALKPRPGAKANTASRDCPPHLFSRLPYRLLRALFPSTTNVAPGASACASQSRAARGQQDDRHRPMTAPPTARENGCALHLR